MKLLIKASLITALLALASCAHHHRGGCDMECKESCKENCKDGKCKMEPAQCAMKKEVTETPQETKK